MTAGSDDHRAVSRRAEPVTGHAPEPTRRVSSIAEVLRRIDRGQQRTRGFGFVVAVVKKFGDDKCSSLAALLTYYGFLAIFPLLLLLTTVLGFVGNDWLQHHAIGNALHQFPVVGQQIGRTVTTRCEAARSAWHSAP